jgi:hypothetical protein
MLDIIKNFLDLTLGWSIIVIIIDGLTGWSSKGQNKKIFLASLVSVPIIGLIFTIIKLILLLTN